MNYADNFNHIFNKKRGLNAESFKPINGAKFLFASEFGSTKYFFIVVAPKLVNKIEKYVIKLSIILSN